MIHKLADEKDLNIEFEQRYAGPQIIWIREGGVSAKIGRISFFIVLHRPKHRQVEPEGYMPQEPPSEGIIDRPIAENQFVQSTFKCQVGDIIILEGGERLRSREEGDVSHYDLCLLATLHSTRRKDEIVQE
jgi:hypothetical protein